MTRIDLINEWAEHYRDEEIEDFCYEKGRADREEEMIRDYQIMSEEHLEELLKIERRDICEKLQRWADETRKVNPDIAVGYDHAIALIRNNFKIDAGMDEWDGQEAV